MAATLAKTRMAVQQAGDAAGKIGDLAATTNGVLSEDVRPAMANLNDAIKSAEARTDTLNAAIGDARPGLQAFSKQKVPEVGQLVNDLRVMSESMSSVAQKLEQGEIGKAPVCTPVNKAQIVC